jgi:hypothetical protein
MACDLLSVPFRGRAYVNQTTPEDTAEVVHGILRRAVGRL